MIISSSSLLLFSNYEHKYMEISRPSSNSSHFSSLEPISLHAAAYGDSDALFQAFPSLVLVKLWHCAGMTARNYGEPGCIPCTSSSTVTLTSTRIIKETVS